MADRRWIVGLWLAAAGTGLAAEGDIPAGPVPDLAEAARKADPPLIHALKRQALYGFKNSFGEFWANPCAEPPSPEILTRGGEKHSWACVYDDVALQEFVGTFYNGFRGGARFMSLRDLVGREVWTWSGGNVDSEGDLVFAPAKTLGATLFRFATAVLNNQTRKSVTAEKALSGDMPLATIRRLWGFEKIRVKNPGATRQQYTDWPKRMRETYQALHGGGRRAAVTNPGEKLKPQFGMVPGEELAAIVRESNGSALDSSGSKVYLRARDGLFDAVVVGSGGRVLDGFHGVPGPKLERYAGLVGWRLEGPTP